MDFITLAKFYSKLITHYPLPITIYSRAFKIHIAKPF